MQTDETLMMAYREGDTAAFDELVRRHWDGVTGVLHRVLRDAAAVDDVLVEVFFKLHRAAPTYRPDARFKTFLYRIAYHEAITLLRSDQRRREGGKALQSHLPGLQEDRSPHRLNSEQQLLLKESVAELDVLLESLSEQARTIMQLFYREELPTAEIAEILDIPATSVRAHLSLARKALRSALAAGEPSPAVDATGRRR